MSATGLPAAFLARDWRYETSYRGMFLLQLVGITGSLLLFYAIGSLVDDDQQELAAYGGSYFPFALIGLIVSDFFNAGLRAYANRLRLAQTTGTIEAMLVCDTPPYWIIAWSGLWDLLLSAARLVIAVALGVGLVGIDFQVNALPAVVISMLSLVTFCCLGILLAALIMIVKRGDAAIALGNILATVFAGTFFPIDVLPVWIRWVAYLLPLHYALDGLRKTLLVAAPVQDVTVNIVVLAGWALVLIPLSRLAVDYAIERSRAAGSLGQY